MNNAFLEISDKVRDSLSKKMPVVALESSGLFPQREGDADISVINEMEQMIIQNGAIPAIVAIIGGKVKVGLSKEEVKHLADESSKLAKVSRRDLPIVLAKGVDGVTTVSATMMVADLIDIPVVVTGGIGGVSKNGENTLDISSDLEELNKSQVVVVSAGCKPILDLGLTLEYLETNGIPVVGYETDDLPAYYSRTSGYKVPYSVNSPQEIAKAFAAKEALNMDGSILVTNPIPEQYSLDINEVNQSVEDALKSAKESNVPEDKINEYLIDKLAIAVSDEKEGAYLNIMRNNAQLGAWIAFALSMEKAAVNSNSGSNEQNSKKEADKRAKEDAEQKAKSDAEAKAKIQAMQKARLEAAQKANMELVQKAKLEAAQKANLSVEKKAESSTPKKDNSMTFELWLFAIKALAQTYDTSQLIYQNLPEAEKQHLKEEFEKSMK